MKIIVTSVDALYDEVNDKPYDGIFQALDEFISQDGNEVVVASLHKERLINIPDRYNPVNVRAEFRRTGLITELRRIIPGCTLSDALVLGAKKDDLILAAQEKVPLLTTKYTGLPPAIVGTLYDYGMPINSAQALREYLTNFLKITNPWYYSLKVSDRTTLYSLTNAQTYLQTGDIVKLKSHFQDCLKKGNATYRQLFETYFLMSCYSDETVQALMNVDYWGIYPSSGTDLNQDLDSFKELARTTFNGKPKRTKNVNGLDQQIFLRTKSVSKRHHLSQSQRLTDGCAEQLKTIEFNPKFSKNIAGSKICIIDDFSRYGTSCETARIMLESAGASEVVFLTMGKFGKDYYKYDYKINGNILSKFTASIVGNPLQIDQQGVYNSNSNSSFLNSLKGLL